MITSPAALASARTVTVDPVNIPQTPRKVGELDARWRRDESIYVGNTIAKPFTSLDAALSNAAGISQQSGYAVAVTRSGDSFLAQELLQPVWSKSFGRENAHSLAPAQVELIGAQTVPGDAKFGFNSYRTDKYGSQDSVQRTGTIRLDAAAGVAAIVGGGWAFVDGQLRSVKPTRPQQPDIPNPPIDPKPPVDPPTEPTGRTLVEDVTEAVRLARAAADIIGMVPKTDKGDESTKEARIKAFKTNMAAQERIERQFSTSSQEAVSALRSADASLEDANWQLAKKPSPDGRFSGVDVPGAFRDTQRAIVLLDSLLTSLTQPQAA